MVASSVIFFLPQRQPIGEEFHWRTEAKAIDDSIPSDPPWSPSSKNSTSVSSSQSTWPHLTLQFTQLSNSMMHACLGSGCRWEAPGIRCHDRQLPRQDPRMSSLSIPFPFSSLSLLASAFQTLGGQGLSLTQLLSFLFASLINYCYYYYYTTLGDTSHVWTN